MTRPFIRKPARQRGSFAIFAALMLVIVVAVVLRYMLAVAESSNSATVAHLQGVKALMAADSGAESLLATLRKGGPLSCNASLVPGGTLDGATYSVLSASTVANMPVATACNGLLLAYGCRAQLRGTSGSSMRDVNIDIAYCSPTSAGVTQCGGTSTPIVQTIVPYQANSVIFSNLAFRRQQDSPPAPVGSPLRCVDATGAPNAQASTCVQKQGGTTTGSCAQGWDILSSSGQNSVGGVGVVTTTSSVNNYTLQQTLSADRNYVATGAIFEGTNVTYLGAYADQNSASNKGTTGTSNTLMGQVQDGRTLGTAANGTAGWCKGADTLIFGFSARSAMADDTLTSVTFGASNTPLRLLERSSSRGYDLYSEVWYLHKPIASGGVDSLFANGVPTDFYITKSGTTTDQWAAGFACLKNVDPVTPRGLVSYMQPYNWWEAF